MACSTLNEFKEAFNEEFGDDMLPYHNDEIRALLQTVPGVSVRRNKIGTEFWLVDPVETLVPHQHVAERPKRPRSALSNDGSQQSVKRGRSTQDLVVVNRNTNPETRDCSRSHSQFRNRVNTQENQYGKNKNNYHHARGHNSNHGYLYGHQLIGDDFFMSLLKCELNCTIKRGKNFTVNFALD